MRDRSLLSIWGKRLRDARKAAGLTQLELAVLLGTIQEQISRWECGVYAPVDEMRPRIAKALGVTVLDLFPYPGENGNGDEAAA